MVYTCSLAHEIMSWLLYLPVVFRLAAQVGQVIFAAADGLVVSVRHEMRRGHLGGRKSCEADMSPSMCCVEALGE